MPYLVIASNVALSAEAEASLLKEASRAVAAGTGKPEQYVMVRLESCPAMFFAGSAEPTAFLELKSIGFPAGGVKALAATLCELAVEHLGVQADRVFTVFTDVKATMWGQGGETFG